METTRRTIAKAASWQSLGLFAMTAITYVVTGSVSDGGLIAVVGCTCGMAMYVLHERVWANIAWGKETRRESVERIGERERLRTRTRMPMVKKF